MGARQTRQQVSQGGQSLDRDDRSAEREPFGARLQHPAREGADRPVRQFAEQVLAEAVPYTLADAQGLTEQRVPPVVNRGGLRIMGTM